MIHLTNEQKAVPIPAARVRRLAAQILGRKSLSVAFVTNAAIRKINRRFLNHDYATDVISFPLHSDLLGELVISAEYAKAEAAKRKIPVEEELLRYVAHGILHLLGYDDQRPADRRRMWARQERELGRLLRPSPLR
jgi:probable rRNA maturation factor